MPTYYQEQIQNVTFFGNQLMIPELSKQDYYNKLNDIIYNVTNQAVSRCILSFKLDFEFDGYVNITIGCLPIGKYKTPLAYFY